MKTNEEVRNQYRAVVREWPLTLALWWFIENAPQSFEDADIRSELFFALRVRVREFDRFPGR
jgi:hypothetical protein